MSTHRVVSPDYMPEPGRIDASRHLWDSFDHYETETSAGWVVRFCQERGQGWAPFSRHDIEEFYARRHQDGFTFNRLVPAGWVVWGEDELYRVTDDFVLRCYKSSPRTEAGS